MAGHFLWVWPSSHLRQNHLECWFKCSSLVTFPIGVSWGYSMRISVLNKHTPATFDFDKQGISGWIIVWDNIWLTPKEQEVEKKEDPGDGDWGVEQNFIDDVELAFFWCCSRRQTIYIIKNGETKRWSLKERTQICSSDGRLCFPRAGEDIWIGKMGASERNWLGWAWGHWGWAVRPLGITCDPLAHIGFLPTSHLSEDGLDVASRIWSPKN